MLNPRLVDSLRDEEIQERIRLIEDQIKYLRSVLNRRERKKRNESQRQTSRRPALQNHGY